MKFLGLWPRQIPRGTLPFLLGLGAYLVLLAFSFRPGRLPLAVWWSVQAVGWASCFWFLQRCRGRWPSLGWMVLTALAFRVCGLWATPTLEDDFNRYLWDGWRTVQDGSPYHHAPQEFFQTTEKRPPEIENALNEINHPELATIYGPITQLLFAASALLAPGSLFVFKLLLLFVDGVLLVLLARWGGRGAAWFCGWCPLVISENAFHAHPEAWALLWLIAALLCAKKERWLWAGALIGVAVGAKLFALLAVPFLVWRRPRLVLPAFVGTLALLYLPLWLSGSLGEWNGLRAMAGSFEFNSFGYALLATGFGVEAARLLWALLFVLTASWFFLHWARREGSLAEAPLASIYLVFLLLTPVLNPWYAVWLVPFLAVAPSLGGLVLLVVLPLSYATGLNLGQPNLGAYAQPDWVGWIEFGLVGLAGLSSCWLPWPKLRTMLLLC